MKIAIDFTKPKSTRPLRLWDLKNGDVFLVLEDSSKGIYIMIDPSLRENGQLVLVKEGYAGLTWIDGNVKVCKFNNVSLQLSEAQETYS